MDSEFCTDAFIIQPSRYISSRVMIRIVIVDKHVQYQIIQLTHDTLEELHIWNTFSSLLCMKATVVIKHDLSAYVEPGIVHKYFDVIFHQEADCDS